MYVLSLSLSPELRSEMEKREMEKLAKALMAGEWSPSAEWEEAFLAAAWEGEGEREREEEPSQPQPDLLSELPEEVLLHILSCMPTRDAARTSLVSRRFRHLWKRSTSLDLELSEHRSCSSFVKAANRALGKRRSIHSLLRLRLDLCHHALFNPRLLSTPFVERLLRRASELGLRHLSLTHLTDRLDDLLPTVLSIPSLHSLSLHHLSRRAFFPARFPATALKSLTLTFHFVGFPPSGLNPFLSQLPALDHLHLHLPTDIDLHSLTVKTLKLSIFCSTRQVTISMPNLRQLEFQESSTRRSIFRGDMPLLNKARIHFMDPAEDSAPALWQMLKAVSNVSHLHIIMLENHMFNPFHTMVEPEADPPHFPNLKHLDLEMCFHKYNHEDLTILLQNSPALQSLNLVDKPPCYFRTKRLRRESVWWCTLPPNVEGFHVGEAKTRIVRRLLRKRPIEMMNKHV